MLMWGSFLKSSGLKFKQRKCLKSHLRCIWDAKWWDQSSREQICSRLQRALRFKTVFSLQTAREMVIHRFLFLDTNKPAPLIIMLMFTCFFMFVISFSSVNALTSRASQPLRGKSIRLSCYCLFSNACFFEIKKIPKIWGEEKMWLTKNNF